MGLLKVGRVGLDVELDDPQLWDRDASADQWEETIEGFLRASSLAETKILRSELLAQVGHLVPVTYSTDTSVNAVGILEGVEVSADWRDAALQGPGYFRFSLAFNRVGSYSEVEFQSLLSMVSAAEDHATTPSYWHSPPVGARAYSAGAAAPTLITRDTEDGDIHFAYDIPAGTHPTWSVDPSAYYGGAAEIWAGNRLRSGREMPMDPTDWFLTNGLMQVRPSAFQATSDGQIEVRFWDGAAWDSWIDFKWVWAGTSDITAWHFVSILRNDAEAVAVRLVRDAAEDSETTAKHELDLTLRRGGRFVTFIYKFDGTAQTHKVMRATVDAATRPGGTASYVLDAGTIDGHRWVLGCPKAFTADTTNGGLSLDVASQSMPGFIGAAVGDAANDTGNGPADLAKQFVGQVAESVRAVRR